MLRSFLEVGDGCALSRKVPGFEQKSTRAPAYIPPAKTVSVKYEPQFRDDVAVDGLTVRWSDLSATSACATSRRNDECFPQCDDVALPQNAEVLLNVSERGERQENLSCRRNNLHRITYSPIVEETLDNCKIASKRQQQRCGNSSTVRKRRLEFEEKSSETGFMVADRIRNAASVSLSIRKKRSLQSLDMAKPTLAYLLPTGINSTQISEPICIPQRELPKERANGDCMGTADIQVDSLLRKKVSSSSFKEKNFVMGVYKGPLRKLVGEGDAPFCATEKNREMRGESSKCDEGYTAKGLRNVGNTCYMNAVLHSMLNIDSFLTTLVYNERHFNITQYKHAALTRAVLNLVRECSTSRTEVRRSTLLDIVKTVEGGRFSRQCEEDAHEFLVALLRQLKEDHEKASKSWKEIGGSERLEDAVTRSFGFKLQHTIVCNNCGEETKRIEEGCILPLHLPPLLPSEIGQKAKEESVQSLMSRNMQSEDVEHLCDVCYSKNALIHHSFVKLPISLIVMLKRFEYGGKFASGCKRIDQIGIPLRIYLNKSIVSGTRTENGEHKRDDVIVMEERPKRIECQRDIKQDESGDQVGRAPPAIVSGCKRHCDGEFEEIMSEEETDDSNYASSELSDQRQLLKEGDAASHNAGSTSKEQFIRKQIRNHLGETYQRAQIDDYPAADCHFNHMNGSVCAQSVSEDGKELEEVGKKTTERMRLGGNDTNRKVDDGSQFLSIARECSADSDHTIHCGMHLGYSQADLGRTFEPHEHSSKSRLWLEENNWPTNDSLQMDVKVRQKKASSEKEKTRGTFKEKLIEVVDETSFASVEEIGGASLSACNVLFSPPSVAFLCRARSIFGLRRAGLSERSRLFASFTRTLKCIRFDSRPTETAAVCSDGNCLFRAISFLLTEGDEEQHMTIRTKVVEFEKEYFTQFERLVDNGRSNLTDHLAAMSRDGEWGTALELFAIATMLQAEIWTFYGGRWLPYKPRFWILPDGSIREIVLRSYTFGRCTALFLLNENSHFSPVMNISHEDAGNHFRLMSVVSHEGTSTGSGHYVSDIWDEKKQTWIHCDDDEVSETEEHQMLASCSGNAYLLFYSTCDPDERFAERVVESDEEESRSES